MKKPKIKKIKDDTGFSASDFITSDNTVKLVGKAEAKAKVIVYEDGTKIGSAKADKNGKWTFTTSALADGEHVFKVKTKENGSSKKSDDQSVTVDTVIGKPTIKLAAGSDTGKSSSDHITNDTTPTLSGTAEAGAAVEIFDGASSLGTAVADSGGAWTFTTVALASGSHSFTTTATDTAGNVSAASAALAVTIDTTVSAPSKPDLAATSDSGASSADNITGDTTPTLTGRAEAGATVTVKDGSTVLGTTTANGSGAWSFTTGALGQGVHSFTATATDTAGNVSAASSALSVTIDTSVSAPSKPDLAAASDSGTSATDNITNDTTPTLTGTAEAGSTVTIKDGVSVLGTTTANGAGAWSFTPSSPLSDGAHSFTATAIDPAGNATSASLALTVTIDTSVSAPSTPDLDAASDTGASSTDNITDDHTPTLTGTAEAGAVVEIFDGVASLGTVVADGGGAWSFTTGTLVDGAHNFAATATDAAGNVSTASGALAVTIVPSTLPAAPTVPDLAAASDTGASDTDNIINDTTPTLTGTADAGVTIEVFDGLTSLGTTVADGGGAWSLTTGVLSNGAHAFTATATDAASHVVGSLGSLAVTIDTTPPAPQVTPDLATASDSGASDTDNITSDTTPTVTGTAEAGATVEIFDDLSSLGTTVADGSGNWSFTTDPLDEGTHSFTAQATDIAGNTGAASAELMVTVDTTAPAAPAITGFSDDTGATGDGITADDDITLAGTAEAGASIEVFDGLSSLGTTVADGSGDWSLATGVLTPGAHSFTAAATDAAGNAGVASAALDVTYDPQTIYDLTVLNATQGFVIRGEAFDYRTGASVDSAGDINGDGYDDLIVGATLADLGGSRSGNAYVVFGSASGFGVDIGGRQVIDLTTLSAAQGFIIQGDESDDQAGRWVSSAGDVNGDGLSDMIVGARYGDDGGTRAGEAYVLFGSMSGFGVDVGGRQVVDLTTLSAAQGFIIQGDAAGDYAGVSVSSAGDINGDGFDDLIVGASRGDDGGSNAGEAYVLFGTASGFGTDVGGRQVVDLTTLTASQGFIIQGAAINDQTGATVSSAGDVNGDGYDDLIVGAPLNDDTDTNAGNAYVLFGSASGFGVDVGGRQVVDLATLSAAQGFVIHGGAAADQAGFNVSSAGDVNGDGLDDLIVGAPYGDDGAANGGEAYVVFGTASGFGTDVGGRQVIDLATLSAAQGFVIQDGVANDQAGFAVSSAGDINGDGFDDLLVGARYGSGGGVKAGDTYVLFGSASGFGTDVGGRQVIDLASLTAQQGFVIQGDAAYDRAGASLAAAGDVNGDGFDDLIIGASRNSDVYDSAGAAYVFFGGAFGGSTTPVVTTGSAAAEVLIGGPGKDVLAGGGGADVIRGGAGDDIIGVSDTTFARIAGGTGSDTLRIDGSDITLDLRQILPSVITDIERIDLTGTGDNSLTISQLDVFNLTGERAAGKAIVWVTGDAGDSVAFAEHGWSNVGIVADGSIIYERYVLGNAEVRVEQGVAVGSALLPLAPSTPDLAAASDTGALATDDITSDTTPTLTGTAEAGATVEVFDGLTSLGTTVADGSGNWSFTTGALADGVHNFAATATNSAGTGAESTSLAVTIDTAISAPSTPDLAAASDTGASPTDDITNDTTPTLTGTAEADATIEIFDGLTSLGTTVADGGGAWSFTTSILSNAVHSFTATATDTAGNTSTASGALAVTIDTAISIPSTPDLAAASDTGASSTDNVTGDTTPTLTGTADAGATVEIYDGVTSIGSTVADGGGAWSFTAGSLANGVHTFSATATDVAGNVSGAFGSLAVTIDATTPAAPSTPDLAIASDSGASSTDNITNDTTPTLTGTAESGATIEIFDGVTSLGTTVADGSAPGASPPASVRTVCTTSPPRRPTPPATPALPPRLSA